MLRRAGAGCSKRNFGDKTEGDNERPRDGGFVGVLPRWSGSLQCGLYLCFFPLSIGLISSNFHSDQ